MKGWGGRARKTTRGAGQSARGPWSLQEALRGPSEREAGLREALESSCRWGASQVVGTALRLECGGTELDLPFLWGGAGKHSGSKCRSQEKELRRAGAGTRGVQMQRPWGCGHGPGRKRPHGEAAVLELRRSQQVSSVGVCGMKGLGRHAQVGAGPDRAEGSGGLRRRPQTSGTCP